MIHLYHGDGKGKTTAACGLAIRAAGSGMRVLFVQFLKDGASSEIKSLSSVAGITVRLPDVRYRWYKTLTEEQKAELKECYFMFLQSITESIADYDMLVLDEAVLAYHYGLLDGTSFLGLLKSGKNEKEIVLTGRYSAPELSELSDYITQMKKEKHPFDSGVTARQGIEF